MSRIRPLVDGWQLASTPAGKAIAPAELEALSPAWRPACVPGTVASALHGDLDCAGPYDSDDWWYRTSFALPAASVGARMRLRFEGLATLAEVWLNGEPILSSRNMFVARVVDVTPLLRADNVLHIRFESLAAALAKKRPRPRWRTALVGQQNLRWFRTTLLGRIPGWTPAIEPVGPWGPIHLEACGPVCADTVEVHPAVTGAQGRVHVRARMRTDAGAVVEAARLVLDEASHDLPFEVGAVSAIDAEVPIADVPLWWPHTHGEPRCLPYRVDVRVSGEWHSIGEGKLGFRQIERDTGGGGMRFVVNGVPVFCRGACWTTMDVLRLRGSEDDLRRALGTLRDAGTNMLRVGGTMTYESDAFYRLCDEMGILVWQDFMFANMDYPVTDPQFRADIEEEARYQLARLRPHPCVAAFCGGSEIAQQAAMMGLPATAWSNAFFDEALPALCEELHPGIPYFPSTPWGGPLPFHVGTGIAHYYGVGAYRRPFSDLKVAGVRFTPECLGFSNVPEAATMTRVTGASAPPPHHPKWKSRVPRDSGAGWDFEDVRDHYLELLSGRNPIEMRSQDISCYYALSRVVSGECMRQAYSAWRPEGSGCGGALVWFARDLWPGAGWGITDSAGDPKAAYWFLRRAWAPRSVLLTDEGLDGLIAHVVNDSPCDFEAMLEVAMFREGRIKTARAEARLGVPAHGTVHRSIDEVVGYFTDSTNAYRFGPPKHDVIAVTLREAATGRVLAQDFHFPCGWDFPTASPSSVRVESRLLADGRVQVDISSDAFLFAATIACDGWAPDDNHFHVAPGQPKALTLSPLAEGAAFAAEIAALNLDDSLHIRATTAGEVEK